MFGNELLVVVQHLEVDSTWSFLPITLIIYLLYLAQVSVLM